MRRTHFLSLLYFFFVFRSLSLFPFYLSIFVKMFFHTFFYIYTYLIHASEILGAFLQHLLLFNSLPLIYINISKSSSGSSSTQYMVHIVLNDYADKNNKTMDKLYVSYWNSETETKPNQNKNIILQIHTIHRCCITPLSQWNNGKWTKFFLTTMQLYWAIQLKSASKTSKKHLIVDLTPKYNKQIKHNKIIEMKLMLFE